jgi:hypothetical protein
MAEDVEPAVVPADRGGPYALSVSGGGVVLERVTYQLPVYQVPGDGVAPGHIAPEAAESLSHFAACGR